MKLGVGPTIIGPVSAAAPVGQAFAFQISATFNPTSYAATGLPAGLGLSTTTGRISDTPTKAGTSEVTITATNAMGTGRAALMLTIEGPPVITSELSPPARQGVPFGYQITATFSPTGYDAVRLPDDGGLNLPPGLTFNANTDKLSGRPTRAGSYRPLVSATNSGGTGSANLNLVVKPPE